MDYGVIDVMATFWLLKPSVVGDLMEFQWSIHFSSQLSICFMSLQEYNVQFIIFTCG